MRVLSRFALGGVVLGLFATALTLLVFPHFITRAFELLVFPAAGGLAGLVVGAIALVGTALFIKRDRSRQPGDQGGCPALSRADAGL